MPFFNFLSNYMATKQLALSLQSFRDSLVYRLIGNLTVARGNSLCNHGHGPVSFGTEINLKEIVHRRLWQSEFKLDSHGSKNARRKVVHRRCHQECHRPLIAGA